jgi:hypothetical protein
LSHSAGPASAHGPGTAGLAHDHFGLASPVDDTLHACVAVTVRGAAAVARLVGGVPCDKVLPTTTEAVPGDARARWGGRALTEVAWH